MCHRSIFQYIISNTLKLLNEKKVQYGSGEVSQDVKRTTTSTMTYNGII